MSAPRPHPVLGLHRRQRSSGEPFMVAVLAERLVLEPGTELHLRRLHTGKLDSPEFALMVVAPTQRWQPSESERERVEADRLDAHALRRDAREREEPAPW